MNEVQSDLPVSSAVIDEHLAKQEESHKGFWFTVVGLFFCILVALVYINGMNVYDQDRFVAGYQK